MLDKIKDFNKFDNKLFFDFCKSVRLNFNDIFVKKDDKTRYNSNIDFIIGDCGSGKSVLACIIAQKYLRKGHKVYSNIYIEGCRKLDIKDFMTYDLEEGAVVVFDEGATYGLASRGDTHKTSNTQNVIEFFTMYRHYEVEKIIIISPSFQDIIPVVRSRVKRVRVIKNPHIINMLITPINILLALIGYNPIKVGLCRYIGKSIDIVGDNGGGEPKEVYKWLPFFVRSYFIQNKAYPYFNSYSRKVLPKKNWFVFGK